MSIMPPQCFTLTSNNGVLTQLITPVKVQSYYDGNGQVNSTDVPKDDYTALWDTGATSTCISEELAAALGLVPITRGVMTSTTNSEERDIYVVNLYLPNHVLIKQLNVISARLNNFSMLIGMDIITKGDFVVSNFNQKTILSFRMPSLQEYDFVKQNHLSPRIVERKIDRNSQCPCGSGKKYKLCCGKPASR